MARIQMKKQRRYRVQISISKGLWERYNSNLELAKQLGAEIDFSKDFEVWFARQNDQVAADLQQLLLECRPEAGTVTGNGGGSNGDDQAPH